MLVDSYPDIHATRRCPHGKLFDDFCQPCEIDEHEDCEPMKHTDTDRLERICGIVIRLVAEYHEPHRAISMSTLNGLKRVAQAALDASRAERTTPRVDGGT